MQELDGVDDLPYALLEHEADELQAPLLGLPLHLVEVEDRSYRDSAEDLGIKLENLKMVIFRARRKIHRAMRRVFDGLPPDCRPARDPKPKASASRSSSPTAGKDGMQ